MAGGERSILVVTGLSAEARIVAGAGVVTVSAPPASLPARLEALGPDRFAAVVSFGLAGGLAAHVMAGTLIVPSAVLLPSGACLACDRQLSAGVRTRLAGQVQLEGGVLATAELPLLLALEKQALHAATGAVTIDTESHIAGAFAVRAGVPFLVIRAVADVAGRDLPPLALAAIGPDGRLDATAIGRQIALRPGQLLALPATALAGARAMRTLRRVRRVLGPGFGLLAGVGLAELG